MSKVEREYWEEYKKQCEENNAGEKPSYRDFLLWLYNNNIMSPLEMLEMRRNSDIANKGWETKKEIFSNKIS